nr:AMP-binding protein [Bacteroidota bacterium]
TILNQTPSAFKALQEIVLHQDQDLNVRYVIFGGEALTPSMISDWKSRYKQTKFINMYGITETTVHVTYKEIGDQEIKDNTSNIGTPIPTLGCIVVDQQGALVPKGVPGELYVYGAGLARGYLNRPELTAERFPTLEINTQEPKRYYKTGDLALINQKEELEYLGRIDDQVKIRGYRIELGEIQTQLELLDGVKQAIVLANEDHSGDTYLAAYLLAKKTFERNTTIEALRKILPEYMVPQIYVELDQFPITSNGKINKKALPSPDGSDLNQAPYLAPNTEAEHKLVTIWQNLLGIDKIGIDDNFFALGGDSIKIIRLVSKINTAFETQIPIASFYENPTIKSLAACLLSSPDDQNKQEEELLKVKKHLQKLESSVLQQHVQASEIAHVYPMSDIQMGMIVTSQLRQDKGEIGVYHDQFAHQLPLLDVSILNQALQLLVDKHQTLRTIFDLYTYTEPVQIILNKLTTSIHYEDLTVDKSAIEIENYIEEFLKNERENNPFDVTKAPLWRISLLKISPTQNTFINQFHHAILDGWSEKALKVELFNIYNELKANEKFIPSPLKCSMFDSVVADILERENENNKAFWKKELRGYHRLEIFAEKQQRNTIHKAYEKHHKTRLLEKCKEDNILPKDLFLGAYLYSLSILSFEKDITIGLVSHRRPLVEDGDALLGCFLNTLPFRFNMLQLQEKSWVDYIRLIAEKNKELRGKDRLSFSDISRITGETKQGENPFFDTIFNYVDFHVLNDLSTNTTLVKNEQEMQEKQLTTNGFSETNTYLDLSISATGDELIIIIRSTRELNSNRNLNVFIDYFDNFLNVYLNDPKSKIDSNRIISQPEKQLLLETFNDTNTSYPEQTTIIDLFQEQVK